MTSKDHKAIILLGTTKLNLFPATYCAPFSAKTKSSENTIARKTVAVATVPPRRADI